MFPHVPAAVIARDLSRTGMSEMTVDNILEGRLDGEILAEQARARREQHQQQQQQQIPAQPSSATTQDQSRPDSSPYNSNLNEND